jgi:hypothetical protein
MSFRFTVVETSLNRAEFRWKWLRVLQHSFVLGAIVSMAVLLFGLAILDGGITSTDFAVIFFALLAGTGLVAWVVIVISIVAGAPDRSWLAAVLERVDHRLLDRLNTLLFLEGRRNDARADSFAARIACQTDGILAEGPSPAAFPATRPMPQFLAFAAVLALTVLFYQGYSPWQHLLAAQKARTTPPAKTEKPLELALPATNNVEQNLNWGEVRITDPGVDLRVTKVDVVALQIEAAANQPLKSVGWFSTINGADETPHELPPPAEPRFAVYQPTLYLDELKLSDWDVLTYYAKASTDPSNSLASEVYFLEVRPFREDILKIPGGEGGSAYQSLSDISGLIRRQQHVIRQTYQHVQQPPPQESLQTQDRMKLSEAEADLSGSAGHLYAKMAAEMENQPIGEALDNLAKAEKSLDRASALLQDNAMVEAQDSERGSLADLVAARKTFQKAITETPKAFDEAKEDEPAPVADASKKLSQMTEFRNEARAAQEVVRKTLEQQRSLEQQARFSPRGDYSRVAAKEQQLQQSFSDFHQQHPEPFKSSEGEAQQAQQAMSKAADALQSNSDDAWNPVRNATRQLQQLNEAINRQSATRQLADAYRLKQMLDKQTQTFDRRAQPDSRVPDTAVRRTAGEARETINQLKQLAEQEPTRDAFGQPLREALNGQNKVDLDATLMRLDPPGLDDAQDDSDRRRRAGEARDALARVGKAFEASQPEALRTAQTSDSLKAAGQDSFNDGMAELDSLAKQMENNRQISREDQARQGRQALYNLQTGLRSRQGDNDRGNQILLHLEQTLAQEGPLDVGNLKKLMDELQHFSIETSDQLARKEDKPEVTHIDPARLPPAYRGRIQKYFQKLSEQ